MTEKPLHVRVAETLGWMILGKEGRDDWVGTPPGWDSDLSVPRYDTDWSATGPLIEKYGATVEFLFPGDAGQDGFEWLVHTRDIIRSDKGTHYTANGSGPTPLIAVCNLILALKEKGEL